MYIRFIYTNADLRLLVSVICSESAGSVSPSFCRAQTSLRAVVVVVVWCVVSELYCRIRRRLVPAKARDDAEKSGSSPLFIYLSLRRQKENKFKLFINSKVSYTVCFDCFFCHFFFRFYKFSIRQVGWIFKSFFEHVFLRVYFL